MLITGIVFWGLSYYRLLCKIKNLLKRKSATLEVPTLSEAESGISTWLKKGFDKFNIGGGNIALEGYVNVDFLRHETVSREVIADIRDLSFFPSQCAMQIHSSHLLEHLSPAEIVRQLDAYYRILKPQGLLSIRCPNTLGACYAFWFAPVHEDDHESFIEMGFPPDESFGDPADGWGHKDLFALFHWLYGDIGNAANQHLTNVTPTKLQAMVKKAGFEILKCTDPEAVNIALIAKKSL